VSEVWVDTDRMDVVVPQLDHLRELAASARSALVEALTPLDGAAGQDDAAAKSFYQSYNPQRDMVLGAIDDFTKITDNITTGIHTMVRGYTATEQNNTVPHFGGGDTPPPDHQNPKPPPARP
jgi:hypothetical protein